MVENLRLMPREQHSNDQNFEERDDQNFEVNREPVSENLVPKAVVSYHPLG